MDGWDVQTAICDTGVKILGPGKKSYLEKNLYKLNQIKLNYIREFSHR